MVNWTLNLTERGIKIKIQLIAQYLHSQYTKSQSAIVTGCIRIFSALASLAFSIVGARVLGPDEFGSYVSIMAATGLIAVLLSLGLPQLLEREVAVARGSGAVQRLIPALQFAVIQILVLTVVSVAIWVCWGARIGLVFTFVALTATAGALGAIHSGSERVMFTSWTVNVFRPGASLVAILILSFFSFRTVEAAFVAQIASVGLIVWIFILKKPFKYATYIDFNCQLITKESIWSPTHSKVALAALTFCAMQVVINATTQIDILVLTALVDQSQVAHYFAAARAANVVSFFYGAALALASPKIMRLAAGGNEAAVQQATSDAARTGFALTGAAALCGTILSPVYLTLYGPSFLEAQTALTILMVGFGGVSLFGPAQIVLIAYNRERLVFAITVGTLILNSVVAVILIPILGMAGAAIGTAIQMIIYMGGQSVACYLTCGIRTDVFYRIKTS